MSDAIASPLHPDDLIVVLTGAGISVESGLPSFRGPDGLWEGHRLEDVATPEAFARDPETVQRFYNQRRARLRQTDVAPNPAHHALCQLAQAWPGGVVLITQNIDDLHERAGSTDVIHMHGELNKIRCLRCANIHVVSGDVGSSCVCPSCGQPGMLRPHVVWFGEMPMQLAEIERALLRCGLFIAIGTSGVVYPAAGFVELVRAYGQAHTVNVNTDAVAPGSPFAEHRRGAASELVPNIVAALLAQH